MNNEFGMYSSRFQAYVAWVDHNGTIDDKQKEGSVENMSPQTGRNFHLGVFKLSGDGSGVALNVVVPQDVIGSFKVPQVGDIVWIEETRRDYGRSPTYVYSTYNSVQNPTSRINQSLVPQWGSMAGDYGHLRTHRDHNRQFFATINSNFVKKYIRSVTGYRFRQYYRGNLEKGRFAVRGDSVFDMDGLVNEPYLVESGAYIGYGGDLVADQGEYPNPLNVPKGFEVDENYTYISYVNDTPSTKITADHYSLDEKASDGVLTKEKNVLTNKNFLSYQPVLDKDYLEYAEFERELPATEEYHVALRGNNKLLIQDHYGDGEQLLITLKNQYDAGFTVIHNADKGQVRIRDHMGQGVLLEANPDAPRVISWTSNRQVIEQGSVKDVGSFTYIRNGEAFGDSTTSFGTKTGLTKDDVSNQEFLMVSTPEIITELGSRLSTGMNLLATRGFSPGVYIRNNVDPDDSTQEYAMYKDGANMTVEFHQENGSVDGATQNTTLRQSMNGSDVVQFNEVRHTAPAVEHFYSETITVNTSSATKTQEMTRSGGDTITLVESISGENTALSVKTIEQPDGDRVITTQGGASSLTEVFNAGGLQASHETSQFSVTSTKYLNGTPLVTIDISNAGTVIFRENNGLLSPITIGNDGGSGQINIGNSASPVTISGSTINLVAP